MFKKIVRFNDCHNTMDVKCLYKCSSAVMDNLSDYTTLPPGAHDLVIFYINHQTGLTYMVIFIMDRLSQPTGFLRPVQSC